MGRLVTVAATSLRQWALDFEVMSPVYGIIAKPDWRFLREIRTELLSQFAGLKMLVHDFVLDRYAPLATCFSSPQSPLFPPVQ